RRQGKIFFMKKLCGLLGSALLMSLAAWISLAGPRDEAKPTTWSEVSPGVYRSSSYPAGYALVEGESAILIDAPVDAAALASQGVKKVEAVYLTHYHRASV